MKHFKKRKNLEEELSRDEIPIKCLPDKFLWMHVKGGTKVTNVLNLAKKSLDSGEHRAVVWSGSGGGVIKTISCVEILKRSYPVHQVTRLCHRKVEEHWDPPTKDLEAIVVTRKIPSVHILTSLDELDKNILGYQDSQAKTNFWMERKEMPITKPNYKNPQPGGSGENRRKFQHRQGLNPYQKNNRKTPTPQIKQEKISDINMELQTKNKKSEEDVIPKKFKRKS